jgi:hypothetical protein
MIRKMSFLRERSRKVDMDIVVVDKKRQPPWRRHLDDPGISKGKMPEQ